MFGYLTEMDIAVGKIVQKVEAIDATDNTVFIFSSDNGFVRV
jgi:arylsulfatase A-like enzyme